MRSKPRALGAILSAVLLSASPSTAQAASKSVPLYKDAAQPVDRRIDDLLARMTLEEKVAQLETVWESKAKLQTRTGDFSPALASQNFPNGVGGFARPSDYRGVTQSNGAAGAAGRDTTVTLEAKWLGACKPDQKPGDIVMPGGFKMNVRDVDKLKALLPKQ